uniref:THIF-type NAD/FAD binding fold domain-containing protein n=1 Tax=Leptocylindrus aporus TaxID=1398097 RepID=A0A7S0PJK6_9STRA
MNLSTSVYSCLIATHFLNHILVANCFLATSHAPIHLEGDFSFSDTRTTTNGIHQFTSGFQLFSSLDNIAGNDEYKMRFGGVGRLFSDNETNNENRVLKRLQSSTVAVIGIGGVGSWTAEALCRSGVGNIILMDLDDICISNSNRQLHATKENIGKMKVEVMKERLLSINPECNITSIMDFVSVDNAYGLVKRMMPELSILVDAIDGKKEKTALISACSRLKVPIVTVGGAAGRTDPTKIECDDITKVQEDRLLFWCRKDLRQRYGFPKGPENFNKKKYKPRSWRIWAVYSTEIQKSAPASEQKQADRSSSLRLCDGSLGTSCFVTGSYGFVAASKVVSMIAANKLIYPRYHGTERMSRGREKKVQAENVDLNLLL